MTYYFDMDGTIVDLYSVDNVFDKLDAFDVSPYVDAKAISKNIAMLQELQLQGHDIAILTMMSKTTTPSFTMQTIKAKKQWLHEHGVKYSDFIPVPYGANKFEYAKDKNAYIVDDDKNVINSWGNDNKILVA